jgi:hypothetical protein
MSASRRLLGRSSDFFGDPVDDEGNEGKEENEDDGGNVFAALEGDNTCAV